MRKNDLVCCLLVLLLLTGCINHEVKQTEPSDQTGQTVTYEVQENKESNYLLKEEHSFVSDTPSIGDPIQNEAESVFANENLPEPIEAPPRQEGSEAVTNRIAEIVLSVTDGTMYGTGLICWVDGYGLCYDIPVEAEACSLQIEEGALPESESLETHRLLLKTKEGTFCLAELRFQRNSPVPNQFGVYYDIIIMDSDLVDVRPVGADWEAIAPMEKNGEIVFDNVHIGMIASYDEKQRTIDVMTVEAGKIDSETGVELLPDTFSEKPVTLEVMEASVLAVNGDEYEMLITPERFFALLEKGYIGFLPEEGEDFFVGCFLGYEQGQLRYLCEIGID